VTDKLDKVDIEQWAEHNITLSSIQAFKERLLVSVASEKQLIRFAKHGLDKLFSFFLFSLRGKMEHAALEHCKRFLKELSKAGS